MIYMYPNTQLNIEEIPLKSTSDFQQQKLLGSEGIETVYLYQTISRSLWAAPGPKDRKRFDGTVMERSGEFYSGANLLTRKKGLVAVKRIIGNATKEHWYNHSEATFIRTTKPHPNIIRVFDMFIEEEHRDLFIVMELMDKPLATFIKEIKIDGRYTLAYSDGIGILAQVLKALRHLHRTGFVHGDLTPKNVLVSDAENYYGLIGSLSRRYGTPSLIVKVGNYGSCHKFSEASKHFTSGTRGYRAPELVLGIDTGNPMAADIWAFGALAFEVCGGQRVVHYNPEKKEDIDDYLLLMGTPDSKNPCTRVVKGRRIPAVFGHWDGAVEKIKNIKKLDGPIDRHTPVEFCRWFIPNPELRVLSDMIYSCMSWNPENRPTIETLCNNPLFSRLTNNP